MASPRAMILAIIVLLGCTSLALAKRPGSYTSCGECVAAGFGWSESKQKCSPGYKNTVCAGSSPGDEASEIQQRQQYLAKLKAENTRKAEEKRKELAEVLEAREAERVAAEAEATKQAAQDSAEADRVKTVNKAKVKKMRTEIQEADAAGTISFFVWIPITMLATAAAIFVAHLALVQTDTDSSEQSAPPKKRGAYATLGKCVVRAGVEKSSALVAHVVKGTTVVLVDTQYSSENQLRAKIEEPEGWISVYGGDGTKLLKREYSKGAGYHVDSKGMPIMDEEDEDTFVQWGSKKKDVEYLVEEDEDGNTVSTVDIDLGALEEAPSMLLSSRLREKMDGGDSSKGGAKGARRNQKRREKVKAKKAAHKNGPPSTVSEEDLVVVSQQQADAWETDN